MATATLQPHPAGRLPAGLRDLTADWLTEALRAGGALHGASVTAFDWQVLGEGEGFIGQLGRIQLGYDRDEDGAPASVIGKFPSPIAQNRGFGVVAGLYEKEARFYEELAPHVGVRVPRCFYAACEPPPRSSAIVSSVLARLPAGVTMTLLDRLTAAAAKSDRRAVLLIEDLEQATVGDQVAGCNLQDAELALRELARLHATMWQSPLLDRPWMRSIDGDAGITYGLGIRTWPAFADRYRHVMPNIDEAGAWLREHGMALLRYMGRSRRTLLHGDYRLDNIFFHRGDATTLTVIDWQGIRTGNPMSDVAYFLRPNVDPAYADDAEVDLLRAYHEALVEHGVNDYPWEAVLADFRLAEAATALVGSFLLGALDLSHERGVQLLDRALERGGPSVARIDFEALRPPAI